MGFEVMHVMDASWVAKRTVTVNISIMNVFVV